MLFLVIQRLKCFIICIFLSLFTVYTLQAQTNKFKSPVKTTDRFNFSLIQLTPIGGYGLQRKARPTVPAHLHTGIDIKRPSTNYINEPVYPICKGIVISMRDDGPFSQIIIEHKIDNWHTIWSVYEHVAGVIAHVGQKVDTEMPIARFMNKNELNTYGWQFDHFHLEILKTKPKPLKPDSKLPYRYYGTYNTECYTLNILTKYYENPLEIMKTGY
jgi:murein DD-endopeptidase MepM/ murein hydrolase activator NlpD